MSKYVVSWADDNDGPSLSVSVHDTLEDAQRLMRSHWDELLEMLELPEGTTEFDLSDETAYGFGPYGSISNIGMSYRDTDGHGEEMTITEVQA